MAKISMRNTPETLTIHTKLLKYHVKNTLQLNKKGSILTLSRKVGDFSLQTFPHFSRF